MCDYCTEEQIASGKCSKKPVDQDTFTLKTLQERADDIARGETENDTDAFGLADDAVSGVQMLPSPAHGEQGADDRKDTMSPEVVPLLSGKALKKAEEYYDESRPVAKGKDSKKNQEARKVHKQNKARVMQDIKEIMTIANVTQEPQTLTEIAQTVATAQFNAGFGKHACTGMYDKQHRIVILDKIILSDGKQMTAGQQAFYNGVMARAEHAVDSDLDRTKDLVTLGEYDSDVDELLAFLEQKRETITKDGKTEYLYPKEIPYDYLRRLILKGNFGLVNLLLGVANYGAAESVSQNNEDIIRRYRMQTLDVIMDALKGVHLAPDMSKAKLLNPDEEAEAVKFNRSRNKKIQADIHGIAEAARRSVPDTDEDRAQTIALAQNNLGMGNAAPGNIDGKYGKNTQREIAAYVDTGRSGMPAVQERQSESPSAMQTSESSGVSSAGLVESERTVDAHSTETGTVRANDPYAKQYEALGLQPYSEKAFAAVVRNFGQNADKATAIAQLIIWARVQKNPAIAFPIFQGGYL